MSQNLQVQLKKTKCAEWDSFFPMTLKTFNDSKIFVKYVTGVALSCITYIRNIFPENAFTEKDLEGRKIKVLAGNHECQNAYLLTRYIRSALGEVDSQYMRKLILEILTPNGEPIEFYAITYNYEKKPSCTLTLNQDQNINCDDTDAKKTTSEILKTLLDLTEDWGPLPKIYMLQLRILYYEDKIPDHYTPHYFVDEPPLNWLDVPNIKRKTVGKVKTSFHTFSLEAGSVVDVSKEDSTQLSHRKELKKYSIENEQETKNPVKKRRNEDFVLKDPKETVAWNFSHIKWPTPKLNIPALLEETTHFPRQELSIIEEESSLDSTPVSIKPDENDNLKKQKLNENDDDDDEVIPGSPVSTKFSIDVSSKNIMSTDIRDLTFATDLSFSETSTALELKKYFSQQIIKDESKVRCICMNDSKDEEVFICSHCNTLQHFLCYKIWPGNKIVSGCCYICAKSDSSLVCTDVDLMAYKCTQLANLTKYRRLIYNMQWCNEINRQILLKEFDIPEKLVEHVIGKLLEEGYIEPSFKGAHPINKGHLKRSLLSYFKH